MQLTGSDSPDEADANTARNTTQKASSRARYLSNVRKVLGKINPLHLGKKYMTLRYRKYKAHLDSNLNIV